MANSIHDILGQYPIAGTAGYEAKVRRVARKWLELCPIERPTTYYFDSADGDDDTGDGSQANPWQTIAKMNTVVADDVAIKLKAGSIWRGTTTLAAGGASVSAYGTGPAPVISGFTQVSNSGGSNWTVASGSRYTASLTTLGWTGVGWLREQGSNWDRVYKKAANTTEVQNTSYSWFISGDTISINCGGVDPDTVDLEATAPGAAANDGITLNRHGGRVDGVVAVGQACEDDTGAAYGIKVLVDEEEVACCTNVECYYHAVHNWGHAINTSGGRTLLMNAVLGWCASSGVGGVSPHVVYAANGEHEHISIDVDVPYGQLPENVTRAYGKGTAFFAHTVGGAAVTGAMHVINGRIPLGSTFACADLGRAGNVGAPTAIADIRAVFHRCYVGKNPGAAPIIGASGNAWVACELYADPGTVFDSIGGMSVQNAMAGFILSTYYEFDVSGSSATRLAVTNQSADTNILPKFANCHIHVIGNDGTDAPFFAHDFYTNTVNNRDADCYNTLFTAESMAGASAIPAMGNLADNTADTNAFFGFDATDTNRGGYSNWQNSVELDSMPSGSFGEVARRGKTTVAILPEVDLYGRPVAVPGEAIGPYGRPSVDKGNLVELLGELYEIEPGGEAAFEADNPRATFICGDGNKTYARLGGEVGLP